MKGIHTPHLRPLWFADKDIPLWLAQRIAQVHALTASMRGHRSCRLTSGWIHAAIYIQRYSGLLVRSLVGNAYSSFYSYLSEDNVAALGAGVHVDHINAIRKRIVRVLIEWRTLHYCPTIRVECVPMENVH